MSDFDASAFCTAEEIQLGSRSRSPLQERSQQRVAAALQAAGQLLERIGPEETSIPEIAKESGVPRASLYQFYPSKYALFAHLAQIHLLRVEYIVKAALLDVKGKSWEEIVVLLTEQVADYYDATPVASILVLGGPFSRSSYLAQEVTIERVASIIRRFFALIDPPLIVPEQPDVATLSVEISFACMKHGYFRENFISAVTREQASSAAIAYLKVWEQRGLAAS
jgi:AcrR family transcriptional regulator